MSGFCPVPHTTRDQVWLAAGVALGAAAGYALLKAQVPSTLPPPPARRIAQSAASGEPGTKEFVGQVAVVTGAGSGIGRAIAVALSDQGAEVVGIDTDDAALKALSRTNPSIQTATADITSQAQVEAALAGTTPDLLVNCAAVTALEPFLDAKLESFQRVLRVNVEGTFVVSQAVARLMVAGGGGGAILTLSSLASMLGVPHHAGYCSSKGAIDALTRVMALELGPHGIRVNSLNPTLVNTGMGKWAGPEAVASIASRVPLGRIAEECDVVDAALFLLRADMVSGHSLPLDGGSSTRF